MATPKNIIYDSVNDKSTGRKRAESTGGVSVAERARLFGTQIKLSSTSQNPTSQRPPVNKQPTKSNIVHQDRNYQPINQYPKQDSSHSSPQKIPNNYRPPPAQINDKPKREYSSSTDIHNYRQQSIPTYDTFQKQTSHHANYTQIIPGESYTSNDDPYVESYDRHNTNYFQPIQDPLEALYRNSSQYYSQQQIPMTINNNIDGMQQFDLGNLINRIQQDYLSNARPYVSSIQFIENEQSLDNIGFITPSTTRKDYTRRKDDIYLRQGATYHYDVIDTNSFHPGYSKPLYNHNNYSSMKRRKQRRGYQDQASSPIHVFESTAPTNPPAISPATPVQKPPTPVAESSSEEEETNTADTQAEVSKTTGAETSVESEDEPSEKVPAPIKIETPAIQRNGIPLSKLPNLAPKKSTETEISESEESDSDSDSETEDDNEKPKPSPAIRSNNPRTTPQINNRAIPQRTTPQINTRGIPQRTTPQINTRGISQRATTDDNYTDEPPELSNSINSFNLESSKKSSGIVGKLRSIKYKLYGK